MRTTNLHIVLSCTNRKRAPSHGYPRLRDVVHEDVNQRAAAWIQRINRQSARMEARRLYVGEYWRAGLDLAEAAGRYFSTHMWVLSAGLGLISVTEAVPAYGATLSMGHPDSVAATAASSRSAADLRRTWWSLMAAWSGPGTSGPRSLAELAARDPRAAVVICAGPNYLSAVAADLRETVKAENAVARLLVYGSGAPEPGLEHVWVPVAGRLRMCLGGSMASTGPRTVHATVEALGPIGQLSAGAARSVVGTLAHAAPPLPRFERRRLDDAEIVAWIRTDLRTHANATKSSALRRFRDDGMACEQSRFGGLFEAVTGDAS